MAKLISSGLRTLVQQRHARLARARAADVRVLLDGDAIALLDVGASGGIIPRWYPYRESVAFTGVEPDMRSVPELINSPDAKAFRSYEVIPSGAWSQTGTLNVSFTRKPMCSSHFTPNRAFLSRFPEAERFDIVGSGAIDCLTIDELLLGSSKKIDFIKLDLEGGELAVLEGATRTLGSCLGLHVEVSFQAIRESQPLFGDVAGFLQEHGIEFMDFVSLFRWERDSFNGAGQAIFADALFLRGPESLLAHADGFVTARRARVYLAILTIYERFDLALRFLESLSGRDAVLSRGEVQRCSAIIRRRKASFEHRYRVAMRLGRAFSRYAGRDSSLHYIY